MDCKTAIASLTAALVVSAAPAFADRPAPPGASHAARKATAPGQLCKTQPHKKTLGGKGKSPFAACVVGAARAQHEAAVNPAPPTLTVPAKLCKDQSRKKAASDVKSPFAACVVGAAKAQRESA